MWKKGYTWNPVTCSCENGRYTGSIVDDSMIKWDGITETTKNIVTKAIPTNFNEKKMIC